MLAQRHPAAGVVCACPSKQQHAFCWQRHQRPRARHSIISGISDPKLQQHAASNEFCQQSENDQRGAAAGAALGGTELCRTLSASPQYQQPGISPLSLLEANGNSNTGAFGQLYSSSSNFNGAAASGSSSSSTSTNSSSSSSVGTIGSSSNSGLTQPPWPPDVPWGLGKVVQVMGLWLLAYMAMGQVLVPALLAVLDVDQARLSARGAALLNLCLDVGQVVVTLVILWQCLGRYRPQRRGLFPLAWQGGSWLRWVAAGAACFPIVDWLAHSSVVLLSGVEGTSGADVWTAQIESGLCDRDWLTCAAYVMVVSLCAPLWEEAIFRGFLLPSLAKHVTAPAAALGSALIFALCHFRAETFAPLLLLGLVFGGLYVRCNNLLPPMVLHSLWNMYVLGTLVLRMRTGCSASTASLVLAASTQVLLLFVSVLLRYRHQQQPSLQHGQP